MKRRRCDLLLINLTVPDERDPAQVHVWGGPGSHVKILGEAIEVCRRVAATIDRADGADWLEEQLAESSPGVATVVFHSLMTASGPPSSLDRMADTLVRARAAATPDVPLAHLRFEAPDGVIVSPAQARAW